MVAINLNWTIQPWRIKHCKEVLLCLIVDIIFSINYTNLSQNFFPFIFNVKVKNQKYANWENFQNAWWQLILNIVKMLLMLPNNTDVLDYSITMILNNPTIKYSIMHLKHLSSFSYIRFNFFKFLFRHFRNFKLYFFHLIYGYCI